MLVSYIKKINYCKQRINEILYDLDPAVNANSDKNLYESLSQKAAALSNLEKTLIGIFSIHTRETTVCTWTELRSSSLSLVEHLEETPSIGVSEYEHMHNRAVKRQRQAAIAAIDIFKKKRRTGRV